MTAEARHSSEGQSADLREALDIYLSGRSGIRFQDLVRFAGPLFDLYDVDWRSKEADLREREELSTMVAVLDAARLLWAFFSLHEEDSVASLPDLEDAMLGPGAGDEERSNLLILLSLLEEHWHSFSQEERAQAESTPGYALPSFEVLLREFSESAPLAVRDRPTKYGPESLDLPEALALFAEPLLQDDAAKGDPDIFEERVARAQAYWELAQVPDDHYESKLERIQKELHSEDAGPDQIRREAGQMVRRYRILFQKDDQ